MKLTRWIAATFSGVVAAGAITLAGSGTAAAESPTYLWDDYTGSVAVYGLDSTDPDVVIQEYAPNGTHVQMTCWTDNQGNRWFGVIDQNNGDYGYVQANWVYDQTTVPSC